MFVFIYPIFLIAFVFASARFVMLVWLSLSFANMGIQFIFMKREGVRMGAGGVMFASLFLWPVQFAAAINSSQTEQSERENREANRKKVGPLPATIRGTVSYVHHLGTEEGHDAVWLEEFGDLDFMTDSKQFDRIGIAEGKFLELFIEERDAPSDLATGKVLWIIDGKSDDP